MLVPTWGTTVATVVTRMLVLLVSKRWDDSEHLQLTVNVSIIHVKMMPVRATTDDSPEHYCATDPQIYNYR